MPTPDSPLAACLRVSRIYLRTVTPFLHSSKDPTHMANEGTRQGANHDRKSGVVDKQVRLGKVSGIPVSPYRIVIIRDGRFVTAARSRSNEL